MKTLTFLDTVLLLLMSFVIWDINKDVRKLKAQCAEEKNKRYVADSIYGHEMLRLCNIIHVMDSMKADIPEKATANVDSASHYVPGMILTPSTPKNVIYEFYAYWCKEHNFEYNEKNDTIMVHKR